jgi:hypothetical protein
LGGDHDFEDSALDAVHKWQYTPATLNGKPIEAKVFITFILHEGNIKTSIEPDLPFSNNPRKPITDSSRLASFLLLTAIT